MVVDKLFEFIEDIERFCVNHRWSRFFNDWETGDEALDEYAMIYKNCCNDVDEEKDAANDIFTELTEYMDCLYNYIDVDCVKVLDDEKQNARKWLDKVEKVIGSCVFSLKGNDLKGFLIKGYQMCHLIKEAAVKTPDEYYGGRRTDVMPYYIGEGKDQLFNNILNEDNMGKLNEKRFELNNPYPVKKNEIIDIVERSTRLVHTATDDKTIQLYIYSNGSERPEAFAEVEITSVGYILHGAEGYDYQGSSMKEFEDDLRDVVFNFDATTSRRFGENAISKETLFENLLNEDYRNWFNFTIKTEKGRYLKATYPTVTELKRCVTPIFGKFEIINQKKLPLTVTQEILDECPETAYVKAGNSTWAENFYSRVVSKGYAYPIIRKNWDAYLVKDKEGFDSCQKDLVINGIDYFPTDTKVGEKIRWRMDINNAEVSENSLFDSILNEASLKEYFFYVPPRNDEDVEDSIIGYIAAVRDYQTQKTKYVDDDGNVCNSKSQAKVFDTKGKADNYSYDHCPEGWTHFVVALKKSDILNEGRISLDDKIKIIERFKAYCIKYEIDAQPVGECSDGIYVYCNNPNDVERVIRDWREKGFGAVSDGQKVNIYKKSSTILEADDTYKAKVNGKWLKGNKLVKDKKDADTFESKTEPTQRINQMKKDGKLNKNAKPNIVKESVNKSQLFESLLQEEKQNGNN